MPQWFLSGLTLAGKMLPAIGIAMLLRYMPTGKYFQYLLVGFFLSAFLNVPIIGAAIVGVALAIAFYQRAERDTFGVQLTQRAYASAENVQSYKALIARGVKVTAQFVPADKPVSVADLI